MEGFLKCPQLLDLIPKAGELVAKSVEEKQIRHGFSEEKLELCLGPPGGEWIPAAEDKRCRGKTHHESLLSLGYSSSFLHLQTGAVMKEPSQACGNRAQCVEKKEFSAAENTAGTNQKRSAPASVVGWPPIRSFRKNITSGSCPKFPTESSNVGPQKAPGSPKPAENEPKSLFVKINMEGIPIGRKVDLKTYDSYDKLSYVVDELFRGLLAAQSDSCGDEMKDKKDGGKVIDCLLDGSGEYTLAYEDNEGDKMLVGDVPWHMFTSTVKRLRVLKSSELPALSRGSKQGKLSHRA